MAKTRLWQYSTKASHNMAPFAWQAAGMGYVIHTAANRFIVIDGGFGEDAEPLIRLMQRESGMERPEAAVWIITHPHLDHAGALIQMADRSELKEKLKIQSVLFNLPKIFEQKNGDDTTLRALWQLPDKLGCSHICPVTGETIEVDGIELAFLFCHEDMECMDANELSLVFRVSGKNLKKTVMFTGDAYQATTDTIMKRFGAEELKSDICQAAHHGLNGGGIAFYHAVDAKTVLVPIARPAFEAMLYGEYKDDPQADANRALMKSAMEPGKELILSVDGDRCLELG